MCMKGVPWTNTTSIYHGTTKTFLQLGSVFSLLSFSKASLNPFWDKPYPEEKLAFLSTVSFFIFFLYVGRVCVYELGRQRGKENKPPLFIQLALCLPSYIGSSGGFFRCHCRADTIFGSGLDLRSWRCLSLSLSLSFQQFLYTDQTVKIP